MKNRNMIIAIASILGISTIGFIYYTFGAKSGKQENQD